MHVSLWKHLMVRLSNYFELDSKKKKINPIIRQPPFPGCMEVVVLFLLLCDWGLIELFLS